MSSRRSRKLKADASGDTGGKKRAKTSISVKELCAECQESEQALEEWQDRGAIQSIIWPALKDNQSWDSACQLLARFCSHAAKRDGVYTLEGHANKLHEEQDALLPRVLETLLEANPTVTVIHFVSILYTHVPNTVVPHVGGIQLWKSMPPRRRELELKRGNSALRRQYATCDDNAKPLWIVTVLDEFLLKSQPENEDVAFCEQACELIMDLLSTVETRLYLMPYLESIHFSIRVAPMYRQRLYHLLHFPLANKTTALTQTQVVSQYHARAAVLQKMCHRHFSMVKDLMYASVGTLCAPTSFVRDCLQLLSEKQLGELLFRMRLWETPELPDREFGECILEEHLTIPQTIQLQNLPVYPTNLWQDSEEKIYSKLNREFLSYQDYLLRNFELYRAESAYGLQSDLEHVLSRVRPVLRQSYDRESDNPITTRTEFAGWARMALEMSDFQITHIAPPHLSKQHPASVSAEFTLDLEPLADNIRSEWDELGEYDNLFLVAMDATRIQQGNKDALTFAERYGVVGVRGCMILHVRDEEGTLLTEPSLQQDAVAAKGMKRIFKVALDPPQYELDKPSDIYQKVNLVVRRHGRENNFKAVLETIQGLLEGSGSINQVIPPWLQPVVLGYGNPSSALYKSTTMQSYAKRTAGVAKPDAALDYGDTFLSERHLVDSFPGANVKIDGRDAIKEEQENNKRKNYKVRVMEAEGKQTEVEATSYPLLAKNVSGNPVRFTPRQVEAIRSGLSPGLTLVVGPPGTGKTDVAVQIIASLYHSFPTQRTLIITHSNAALNDIFEKVMSRGDVAERYMIRLGSGERDLKVESSHDFTKGGRVSHSLANRLRLLEEVQRLSESLGLSSKAERGTDGAPAYTCETAEYFFNYHIQRRVQLFHRNVKERDSAASKDCDVTSLFPFKEYFKVEKVSLDETSALLGRLDALFKELAEYRPLELLRTQRQRTDYLLMKQVRVVAMTCTHAAIARSHLTELGFEYDNIVMEEAAQMLEIETFIPLLLQRGDPNGSEQARLKRVCLMGDHNQLPPIVKNLELTKRTNFDQSLFTRLIRLGVPHIQLDKQGRARSSIADLYRWRYKNLGDLSRVSLEDYTLANAGFAYTFQFIDVQDFEGKGETTPTPFFYQNLGEAEYAVALFQYMVLIGYPAEKISVLTTYNGQKDLLQDILSQRCGAGTPLAGIRPRAVSTVDQYQGQQNDYVILSLVRTQSIGYLKDIRRLIVALSRSRLGLYILGRQELFDMAHELQPALSQFTELPNKLQLVLNDHYPTSRKCGEKDDVFEVEDVSHVGSLVHSMQEKLLDTQ